MKPATYVYVDGFNLYYGAVKDSAYRWLNIRRLCELLLPHHTIQTIGSISRPGLARGKTTLISRLANRSFCVR